MFATPKKFGGKGRGHRRIGATAKCNQQGNPEAYIPLCEQAMSATEMLEEFGSMIAPSPNGCMALLEEVHEFYKEESVEIRKRGRRILVMVITCHFPWGSKSGSDANKAAFVRLMNKFADHPVTFVFVLEGNMTDTMEYYESLLLPGSDVRADIKVAKGLGPMVDGIQLYNPWLNYCLPMHLCQTLGICSQILSQATRRPLSGSEVRILCDTFVGNIPDPDANLNAFLGAVEALMKKKEHSKWNPALGYDTPMIDTTLLKAHLAPPGMMGCCRNLFGCFKK